VHFAARSATGRDLIAFLSRHRPPGADAHYGSGHAQATGGALRLPDWNRFVADIGFPDQQVPQ
jgi:single-stranded-DNA-specific exonuclease